MSPPEGGGGGRHYTLFQYYETVHVLHSKGKPLILPPKMRKICGENDFPIRGPKYWNSIDQDLKESPTINVLKGTLKLGPWASSGQPPT